ncbi:MAG TPA: hypothetical protein P5081_22580 [Phycisphaerae bacterium]|nr:hypothetical protein [Phycisphaerae bacterium]HRW55669.1 hypothetical protein [Phycisphaerae bacterium]
MRQKRRRRLAILCAVTGVGLIGACNVAIFLSPLAIPDGESPVAGGIVDTRPLFGRSIGADGAELGDFLLATCGCGDWRVLLKDESGDQRQCAIRFFTSGEYSSEGEIQFFGEEGSLKVLGTVDQSSGAASGDADVSLFRRRFSATRRETHTNDIEACILCHIGDDPIYPQPPGHPEYVEGETNCLECHEVVIE